MTVETTASSWRLLRRLLARYRDHRGLVAAVLGCLLFHIACEISLPWLLGRAIDRMIAGVALPTALLVGFAVVGVIRAVSRYGQGVSQTRLAQAIVTDLRLVFHQRMLALSFADHQQIRRGELIARGTRDIEKTRAFFGDMVFQALELVLLVGGALIVMGQASPLFSLLALVLVLLTGGAMAAAAPGLRRRIRAEDDAYDHVTARVQEAVAGTRVIKAFGRERAELGRFKGVADAYLQRIFDAFDYFAITMPVANMMFGLSVPLTLALGGWLVMHGRLELGEVAAAMFYLHSIQGRLRVVGRVVMTSQVAAASAERLFEVLDRPSRVAAPATPRPLPEGDGRVVLDGVSFAYPDQTSVLASVDLEIQPGETLALVGPTGSGKTTLAGLLARFADPTEGAVRLDGVDLRELDPRTLRRAIGFVFQESFLFSETIAGNIAFGSPEASMDEVVRAAELAQADRFIEQLKEGYDTIVGERGVTLSGGQKQRLAIARAILVDPRVLVLDDATASVDSRTEEALQQGFRSAAKDRTTIIVAQRLSTVRHADRIAVLDQGQLVELGTHEALLTAGGLYAQIQATQTDGAVLVEA